MNQNIEKMILDLREFVCVVNFTKVDGSLREMKCTLKSEMLPTLVKSDKQRKKNEDVIAVFDLDEEAWKSFRKENVIGWSVIND
jgi:hypothetical protein